MRASRVLFVLFLLIIGAVALHGIRSGWLGTTGIVEPDANAPNMSAAQASKETRPTFDVVRAEPDGSVIIAGRAEPGWTAIVEDDGKEIGRAKADENGEWIIQPSSQLEKGEHSLELTAKAPTGDRTLFSTQRLALSLAEPRSSQPLVALTEEGKPTKVLQMPAPSTEIAAASGQKFDGTASPTTGNQGAARPSPEATTNAANRIGFSAVDYEEAGEKSMLYISGHAEPGSRVALYVDNRLASTVTADATGRWNYTANNPLTSGGHALRADVVGKDPRKVLARAEVTFQRTPPTTTAMLDKESNDASVYTERSLPPTNPVGRMTTASPGSQDGKQAGRPGGAIIVKQGDTLWHIAQRYYGDGARFTEIFKNNKTQIRNPHWIYPNQRFDLPE